MIYRAFLRAAPFGALLVAVACSGQSNGPIDSVGGGSGSSQGGGSGAQGSGAQGRSGTDQGQSGAGGSGTSAGGGSGTTAGAGSSAGDTSASSGGTIAASGQTTSGSGTTAGSGVSTSGSGAGTASGAGGSGGSAGDSGTSQITPGMSAGCGTPPQGVSSTGFTNFSITLPTCSGTCDGDQANGPPGYPDCIDPCFAQGGPSYKNSGTYDFNHRDFSIQLPANYNPNTPYPIFFGGGGCGGSPPQKGDGFGVGETGAIEVGLSYVNTCFADGGTSCSGASKNEPYCSWGPELPYFRAVLAQVESQFCVDKARVFVGGYSSGGWEAFTLGCGGANLVRGIVTDEGGWRIHQPACTGPVAALMVAGEADTTNPIGPITPCPPGDTSLDSCGSSAARDAILQRNGCIGTNTTTYDPNYPACMQYTGCPAAFPVVWCPLPGAGHNDSSYNGINYSSGSVKNDPLMWNFLSKLPALP